MISWLLGRVSWKTFFAGAAAATVGGAIFRPILVSLVKAGMGAQQFLADAVREAMIETKGIRKEAAGQRAAVNVEGTQMDLPPAEPRKPMPRQQHAGAEKFGGTANDLPAVESGAAMPQEEHAGAEEAGDTPSDLAAVESGEAMRQEEHAGAEAFAGTPGDLSAVESGEAMPQEEDAGAEEFRGTASDLPPVEPGRTQRTRTKRQE
jgi:hypothetical protein